MGGDLTTACFYDQASGKVVAQTGYNRGKANVQLENTQQDMHDFQVPTFTIKLYLRMVY